MFIMFFVFISNGYCLAFTMELLAHAKTFKVHVRSNSYKHTLYLLQFNLYGNKHDFYLI